MKYLALMMFLAMLTSWADGRSKRSAGTLALRARPRLVVQGLSGDLELECRPSSNGKNVLMAVLIHLEKIDENGTTSLVASQRINALQLAENNRTSADGYLQADSGSKESFLTTIIQNPILEDAGVYQCRFAFIDVALTVHTLGARVNVTVSEVPPPFFSETSDCDCDGIRSEVDQLRADVAALSKRPSQPGTSPNASYDDTCRCSFSARFAARHGYQIVAENTAVFDDVISNKGNAYSPETGVFKAPCDGQYYFTASLRSHQNMDSGYVDGVITVDDQPRARTSVFIDAPIDNFQSASNGVVLTLKSGQEVKVIVKSTSTGEFVGEEYSIFSGFFLFP